MSAKDSSEVTIRALVFSGTAAKFPVWLSKFTAIAQAKGYKKSLVKDPDLPSKANEKLDESVATDKVKIDALKRNDNAMAALTLALADNSTTNMYLEGAKSLDFPDGVASVVMDKLKKAYLPKDKVALAQLQTDLLMCFQN